MHLVVILLLFFKIENYDQPLFDKNLWSVDSWLCYTLFAQIKCDVESKQIQSYYGIFIGIWQGRLFWDLSYSPKDIFLLKCFIIWLPVGVFVFVAFMSLW